MSKYSDEKPLTNNLSDFRKAGMSDDEIHYTLNELRKIRTVRTARESRKSVKSDNNVALAKNKIQDIVRDIIRSYSVINFQLLAEYFCVSWIDGDDDDATNILTMRVIHKLKLNMSTNTYSSIKKQLDTIIVNATTKLNTMYPNIPTSIAYAIDQGFLQDNNGRVVFINNCMMTVIDE